ncbi:3-oxoacyl-[acyl-carrier-protein] synthase 2 [Planctomycetes bacterium Pan216]|uniref:3-oxoacyl-[acyl-carrier-protein] synthase 2 n=1 Tax=Kolteria novifilia TaxID=2527975 RepID=A0A518B3R8_9BACT|nr:3-oxoacyl-[acyl-carrier-protein] synthase 2 [Planctomycetes bacterium Pan216]
MRRVFITGVGVVSPIGNNLQEYWNSILEVRSGIQTLETVDLTDLPITIGGEIRGLDFAESEINDKVSVKKMDRASIFSVIAAKEAIKHAGLGPELLGERCGVIIGAGLSGLATLQAQTENLLQRGPRRVSPFTIPTLMPNAAPANVSLAFGITGPAYNVASACASSGHAIIDAYEELQRGRVDVLITGGTESPMTRLAISAFANMKAMTKKYNDNPTQASRPFDLGRDGFVMSEGAAILVAETEEHARARGAKPLAEIVGHGSTMDAFHLVQPDPSAQGAIRAVQQALDMAKWEPEAIAGETYVNAHGTSTKFNDLAETNALKSVFGDSAKKLQVSSTKSMTGHMIGAACAIETVACVLAMQEGILPATANYQTPDPECDLDYIPNEPRKADVRYCINNSFGFGGHNVSLALARPE